MAGEQLKSVSITNLDLLDASGSPILANSAGKGAPGKIVEQSDFLATTLAGVVSTLSTYNMVRVPWTAKLKKLYVGAGMGGVALDTSTGIALDVGAFYTDSTVEGLIDPTLAGTTVDFDVFAAAYTGFQSSVRGPIDILNTTSGTFTSADKNKELWDALGLSKNPGGFCDIVVTIHTVATSGGVSELELAAHYVE